MKYGDRLVGEEAEGKKQKKHPLKCKAFLISTGFQSKLRLAKSTAKYKTLKSDSLI